MKLAKDIENLEDIRKMVHAFYAKVRKDDLIGPIFNEKIGDHWDAHLDKITSFWQGILLNEKTYDGHPFPPHAKLPIDELHFERWLSLFVDTVDNLYAGDLANEAKSRAFKIAEVFQSKLRYLRQ